MSDLVLYTIEWIAAASMIVLLTNTQIVEKYFPQKIYAVSYSLKTQLQKYQHRKEGSTDKNYLS